MGGLAARVARHRRQLRTRKNIRESRRKTTDTAKRTPRLLKFVAKVSPELREPEHLSDLVEEIERGVEDMGSVHSCFSVPVRHGKTTLIQHAIAWLLAIDPTLKILYVSYAHGFAKKQTGKARELAIAAGVQLAKGRRKDEWFTKKGGMVKAAGIGGQITGEGFNFVFVDDPHKNRAEAESRTIREGVIDAFYNDVFTRRDPRGTNFVVVHARWHVNDLIGVLTRQEQYPFVSFNSPAINDNGQAFAPWLFDIEELRKLEQALGPYVFGSLYQGSPIPRGGALFGGPRLAVQHMPAAWREVIGIDLAHTSQKRQDFNAAALMRQDLDRDIFDVVKAIRARGTVTDRPVDSSTVDEGFVRQLVPLLHEHPTAELCMYAAKNEKAMVELLARELSTAIGREVKIHALDITGDKYLRAQRYAAAWNTGKVRLPTQLSVVTEDDGRERDGWVDAFVAEHSEFSGVKNGQDDWVDAAASAYDYLVPLEESPGKLMSRLAAVLGG